MFRRHLRAPVLASAEDTAIRFYLTRPTVCSMKTAVAASSGTRPGGFYALVTAPSALAVNQFRLCSAGPSFSRTRASADGPPSTTGTGTPPGEDPQQQQGATRATAAGMSEEEAAAAAAAETRDAHYDPWKIIGLKEGASAHDIRLRYHELLKQYHPDHVPAGQSGNMEMLHKVEQAYQLITKAPTVDRRYRNLVTDTQYFYYKLLPQWVARNVDEMPRYWSWMRWKVEGIWFWPFMMVVMYMFGLLCERFPFFAFALCFTFLTDVMLHTVLCPIVASVLLLKGIWSGNTYDLAWFHSPKGMLTRGLTY